MDKPFVLLNSDRDAAKAIAWIRKAQQVGGWQVTLSKQNRTSSQNARMWALLARISKALPRWNGVPMSPDRWKAVFMDALGVEVEIIPKLEGGGFVPISQSTSRLTKAQFNDLFLVIEAFAAEQGIDLGQRENAA